jgi:hypothetical protein
MSDDLHTSVALAAISEPLKVMNDLLHTRMVTLMLNPLRCSLSFHFHVYDVRTCLTPYKLQ